MGYESGIGTEEGPKISARECITHIRKLFISKVQRLPKSPLRYAMKENFAVCDDKRH